MGSTVVWLLAFYKAMTMYEKRTIYFMGLASYSPFPALLFIINDEFIQRTGVWIVYAVSFGSGIGVATSFLLPWAMLPDTIDQSEEKSGAHCPALDLYTSKSCQLCNACCLLPDIGQFESWQPLRENVSTYLPATPVPDSACLDDRVASRGSVLCSFRVLRKTGCRPRPCRVITDA